MEQQPEKTEESAPIGKEEQVAIESNSEKVMVKVDDDEVPSSYEVTKGDVTVNVPNQQPKSTLRKWLPCCIVIIVIIVIVVVIVALVSVTYEDDDYPPPDTINYRTGVSLVTSYGINATISSRLATSKVTMEVTNALDCVSIHSISLQLPLATRIVSLQTISDDGCTTTGEVKEMEDARETFLETASSGQQVVYVEQQDEFTHSIQVAIPPLGTSNVEIVMEQLLRQRTGDIEFQIPLVPNEAVDQIRLDLSIEDIGQNETEFFIDLYSDDDNMVNATSYFHLDLPDAREYNLPRVLHGKYTPGKIPDNGVLFTDGECFEHYFHPTSLLPMKRNILFLLDTSTSMENRDKLSDAKRALNVFIDSLTSDDTFTIQTFARRGTDKLWGSAPATEEEKIDAKNFIESIKPSKYWSTDLQEAFLEALLRAKRDADKSDDGTVNILMLLTDGYASSGETNRGKIVENVYKLNQEGKVKIFSLGFQGTADLELLQAIAIMNGGKTAPVLQGYTNFTKQMETFFRNEFGNVLLSDVQANFNGGGGGSVGVYGETQRTFPLLSNGNELVVRGLLNTTSPDASLSVTTSAKTKDGEEQWSTTVSQLSSIQQQQQKDKTTNYNSPCFQSYAHARITQLIQLRDAAKLVGEDGKDIILQLVSLSKPCTKKELYECIEMEAISLALKANVVVKGLTGMVTVEDDSCPSSESDEKDDTGICLDGTSGYGRYDDYYPDDFFFRSSKIPWSTELSEAMMAMDAGGNGGRSYSSASYTTCQSVLLNLVTMIVFWTALHWFNS